MPVSRNTKGFTAFFKINKELLKNIDNDLIKRENSEPIIIGTNFDWSAHQAVGLTEPTRRAIELLFKNMQAEVNNSLAILNNKKLEIDEKLKVIQNKLQFLYNASIEDSLFVQALNEIIFLIEEVKPLINQYNTDATILINNSSLNQDTYTISIDSTTIQTLQNNVNLFNENLLGYNRIIREFRRRLQSLNEGRTEINANNPIDWDGRIQTEFNATTIALGHMLTIKQTVYTDGYSVGKIAGAFYQSPMTIKHIQKMSWNRNDRASRSEEQLNTASITNSVSRDSDTQEIIKTALSESISAQSNVQSKSKGFSIGGSASGPLGGGFFAGVTGGYQSSKQNASSSASQNASRNLASNAMQSLKDRMQQSATSLQSQKAVVIQEVNQTESAEGAVETLVNYNRRFGKSTLFFEINQHYLYKQEVVDVQECLFVPLPQTPFEIFKVYRWRDSLRNNLLDYSHYEAFGAAERIIDNYENIDFPEKRFCDEKINWIEGEITISFDMKRLPDPDEEALQTLIDSKKDDAEKYMNDSNTKINNFYAPWMPFLSHRFSNGMDVFLQTMKNVTKDQRDYIYEKEVVPEMVDKIVNEFLKVTTGGSDLKADFTLVDEYKNKVNLTESRASALVGVSGGYKANYSSPKGKPLRIKFKIKNPNTPRIAIKKLCFYIKPVDENGSIKTKPDGMRIILYSANVNYTTNYGDFSLVSDYNIFDDINSYRNDSANIKTTRLSLTELQNPRKNDKILVSRLLNHINAHSHHYHNAIWQSFSYNKWVSMLDGHTNSMFLKGKSLASVVDPNPIGIFGNSVIFNVVPGANLDPNTQLLADQGISLLDIYRPEVPPAPFRITVPMGPNALYGETVMGKCDSAETIDDSKLWRKEDLELPTLENPFEKLSLASRYQDPGNLQTKDMAPPMINMQTLTPDTLKESALREALGIIGKGDSFKDMTGLEGNQKLVENAQNQNTTILDSTMSKANDAMKAAMDYDLKKQAEDRADFEAHTKGMSPEQKQKYLEDQQKSKKQREEEQRKATDRKHQLDLQNANNASKNESTTGLNELKDNGLKGAGKIVTTGKDGSKTEIDNPQFANREDEFLIDLSKELQWAVDKNFKQSTNSTCWATALAILLSNENNWKDLTPDQIMEELFNNYLNQE